MIGDIPLEIVEIYIYIELQTMGCNGMWLKQCHVYHPVRKPV
jgi:hypothetical protein